METIYDVMKDRLQLTETTLMVTVLSGPRQGDKTIYAEDGSVLYGTPIEGFMVDKAKLNSLCMVGEVECFVQPVENDPSVLVLGAGHVSRAITDLLLFIGCRVTVVDDRPEYVVPEVFDERAVSYTHLKTIIRGSGKDHVIKLWICDDVGYDIDTPDDFERLKQRESEAL